MHLYCQLKNSYNKKFKCRTNSSFIFLNILKFFPSPGVSTLTIWGCILSYNALCGCILIKYIHTLLCGFSKHK